MDGPFYDALEQRDPAEREAALMAALPRVIAAAKEHAPAYRDHLAAVRPADITDRRALAELPLTRKSDLIELQRQNPPFGGFCAVGSSGGRGVPRKRSLSTRIVVAGRYNHAASARFTSAAWRNGVMSSRIQNDLPCVAITRSSP